jgi:CubicO group peptidase (beta-lactamase class C family)
MKKIVFLFPLSLLLFACQEKQNPNSVAGLERRVDSLLQFYLDSSKIAGAAIAVYKGEEKLLMKAYGFADLEFDVELPANASFPIASITKQFTAAAILQLVEQGRLSLDDDLTKYVKFTSPVPVSIRQLLTHTSGIKSFSDMPWTLSYRAQKLPRDTILRLLEKEAFNFSPGDALIYNSSGYLMLGLIIENVTGKPYQEYIQGLFTKAGMNNSYYCSESKVTKNRAHGYELTKTGLLRAEHPNYEWPYAAGALCSTLEDLVKWNLALHGGKILSKKMYEELTMPEVLNDGTVTRYGKGVGVLTYNGQKVVEHPGNIVGFTSMNRYFPDDKLSIIVLINTENAVSPFEFAGAISNFFYPKIMPDANTFQGDVSRLAGVYRGRGRFGDQTTKIVETNGSLSIQLAERNSNILRHVNDSTWQDDKLATFSFKKRQNKHLLRMDVIYGNYILTKVEN